MTWKNHKLVTVTMSYTTGLPVEGIIMVAAASIFPDAIEFILRLRHRGVSHFWVIYTLAFLIAHFNLINLAPPAPLLLEWFALGCMLHLLQDAMSKSGIELYPGSRKKIILGQLYITKQNSEYAAALIMILVCLGIKTLQVSTGADVWKPGFVFINL